MKASYVTATLAAAAFAAACSSGGGFTAGGPLARSRTPTSWMAHDDTSVEFMQWKTTGTSSDGTDISGTIKGFDAAEQGASPSSPSSPSSVLTISFTGHVNGDAVSLTLNGVTATGTISDGRLSLDSPDDTDGSGAITFTAATEQQYEAAADELRSKAPDLALDNQMKSDARQLGVDEETVAVDAVPFALRDDDGVVEMPDNLSMTLSPGDTASLEVTPDGGGFCVLVANPDASQGWMFLDDGAGAQNLRQGTACPAKYSAPDGQP